jgi:hypothetical protein
MEPNPYEAPATEQAAAPARCGDKRLSRLGFAMVAFAVCLPPLAGIAGYAYVKCLMLTDPVPQGAMVLAYLVLMASIAVAVFLFPVGMGLAWFNRRS